MIKEKFPLAALQLVANSYVTMPATPFIGHWNTFHALWPISISCTRGFAARTWNFPFFCLIMFGSFLQNISLGYVSISDV